MNYDNFKEDKRFYLNMIESVISRMNTNSFLIKSGSLTAIGGLVTFYITHIKSSWSHYILILCLFICLLFWVNDAYYLLKEREYRDLFDKVRKFRYRDIDFNMNATKNNLIFRLIICMFRPSFLITYIPVIFALTLFLFHRCKW